MHEIKKRYCPKCGTPLTIKLSGEFFATHPPGYHVYLVCTGLYCDYFEAVPEPIRAFNAEEMRKYLGIERSIKL